ncbi:MAG: hypothetical protein ACI9BF_000049 [Candidatus Paceibacteria bacterium]|jgi:hypothetical protein
MTQKWNLQDIRPATPRKRRPIQPQEMNYSLEQSKNTLMQREEIPNIVIENGSKKGTSRLLISIVLFVTIVGGAVGLSALTGKTELTIYPDHREPNISAEFTAYPDKREDSLSYEIMTLESTNESQVKATGQIQVEVQAIGTIEIIKTSPGAERLIKNTRFRTPSGLVYRIQESVVVPGSVKDGEGTLLAGTIRAEVFADETGDKYNIPAGTAFDIPGFKEGGFTDLYDDITARNPESINGGFSGPQFEINEDELSTAKQALEVQLRETLLARIENEKPAGFVIFEGAVSIVYNELPAIEYGQDLVTIREQAVLQIPLFKATELGSFLAKEAIATYDRGPVRIDDPSVLTFRYTSATTSFSVIANEPSLSFSLNGKPLLIWEYDIDKLTADLAGLPKTAINNAVLAYPGIDGARAHITPFWKRNFPEDEKDIIFIEELKELE